MNERKVKRSKVEMFVCLFQGQDLDVNQEIHSLPLPENCNCTCRVIEAFQEPGPEDKVVIVRTETDDLYGLGSRLQSSRYIILLSSSQTIEKLFFRASLFFETLTHFSYTAAVNEKCVDFLKKKRLYNIFFLLMKYKKFITQLERHWNCYETSKRI